MFKGCLGDAGFTLPEVKMVRASRQGERLVSISFALRQRMCAEHDPACANNPRDAEINVIMLCDLGSSSNARS